MLNGSHLHSLKPSPGTSCALHWQPQMGSVATPSASMQKCCLQLWVEPRGFSIGHSTIGARTCLVRAPIGQSTLLMLCDTHRCDDLTEILRAVATNKTVTSRTLSGLALVMQPCRDEFKDALPKAQSTGH